MDPTQYLPGGARWSQVQHIMRTTSVTRNRAVAALKACRNDTEAAINMLGTVFATGPPDTKVNPKPKIPAPENPQGRPRQNSNESPELFVPIIIDDGLQAVSPVDTTVTRHDTDADNPVASSGNNIRRNNNNSNGVEKSNGVEGCDGVEKSNGGDSNPPPYMAKDAQADSPSARPIQGAQDSQDGSVEPNSPEWDFSLPPVTSGVGQFRPEEGMTLSFSISRLVVGLQQGLDNNKLTQYFSYYRPDTIARSINGTVSGYPGIFYAVATNDEKLIRTWIKQGGDANAVEKIHGFPLLAFAILNTLNVHKDTTAMVTTLLSLGADAGVIPRAFFTPFLQDPPVEGPDPRIVTDTNESKKKWCKRYIWPSLARVTNISQRYFLEKTIKGKPASARQNQVALAHNATELLGISYFMIGQATAASSVIKKLLTHLALPTSKPLVLVFAGPSGHGKTELAKRLGQLLTLELECVDSTEIKHESDLFGPKQPYLGYQQGSPLNNFLTRMSGKRAIVFLDEFEKTTREVQNACLIPFDEGKYVDRRNREAVDCSKTIWIIATNALDQKIVDFCERNPDVFKSDDEEKHGRLMTELEKTLKKQLKHTFGNPLSGRISAVLPFLPFSLGEQAVVAHKYILELKNKVLTPVNLSSGKLVGRVLLHIRSDGAVCKTVATDGYDPDQGARSLQTAVKTRIEEELVHTYLEEDEVISETQALADYTVDIQRDGALLIFKSTGAEKSFTD